jgi:hypothetical protein
MTRQHESLWDGSQEGERWVERALAPVPGEMIEEGDFERRKQRKH